MSDAVRIDAETRTEFGKGAARRTRRDNKVPAVLYGHGEDPRHLALPGHDLMLALKGGANTLLELQISTTAAPSSPCRAPWSRDPIKGFYMHLDLLVLRKGERVAVDVPVHVTGEAAPETLVDLQHTTTLSVEADAISIPSAFEVERRRPRRRRPHHRRPTSPCPTGVDLQTDPEAVVVQIPPRCSPSRSPRTARASRSPTPTRRRARATSSPTPSPARAARPRADPLRAPRGRRQHSVDGGSRDDDGGRQLAGGRAREPGPDLRREPAQRGLHGARPARRAGRGSASRRTRAGATSSRGGSPAGRSCWRSPSAT